MLTGTPRKASKCTRSIVTISCVLSVLLAPEITAAPSDEIVRAVKVAGAINVKDARSDQFLRAFNSVLVRAKERYIPSYVTAAVKMRPDLADKIVVTALTIHRLGKKSG